MTNSEFKVVGIAKCADRMIIIYAGNFISD
jgi:hypothetical protein